MERLPQYYRCGECEAVPASVDCRDCSESYCADCFRAVHAKGKRATHSNNRRIFVCQRCNAVPATQACGDCEGKVYCERCNARLHGSKGKHKKHAPSVKPVAEFFATGGKAPTVNKDEENGLGLRVDALVASPQRFSRTAAAVTDTIHDVEDAAAETEAPPADGQAAAESNPLAADAASKEAAPLKFIDADTQRLVVGDEVVAERVWGWRRLSRIFPEGSLFETGNKVLRTKCPRPEPDFPDVNDPAVAEAIGRAPGAEAVGVHAHFETLPRFPTRPSSVALDERGVNLAVLAVALAGTSAPLARLFHSFEFRSSGLYSLQFCAETTRPEKIRDNALAHGLPLTDKSPARLRGGCAPVVANPDAVDPDAEALSPRRQYEALVAATGADGPPSVAFLRDVFEKESVAVAVDDLVPTGKDGRPIFGLTDQSGELWRVVLGKGLAKLYGSYAALERTDPVTALRTLTGGRVTAESWGGCGECLDLFPDLEAAARFVWWRVKSAKQLGQMCWFTHAREAMPEGAGDEGDEFSPDRDRDLDDAEAAAADNCGEPAATIDAPEVHHAPDVAANTEAGAADVTVAAESAAETPQSAGEALGPGKSFHLPAGWGTQDWASRQGATAEVGDAAVAIHTAEMSLRAANNAGVRRGSCAAPPSAEGWQLVKLNQLAGDLGAERFSYAHFSGQWTKDLRDRFDFKSSDSDIVMGTAEDLAECFDTITCCSAYVGAPPSANFVLAPQPTQRDACDYAQRLLVVLRPGVTQLSVTNAAAFDLRTARPVAATAALHLHLFPVAAESAEAFLSLPATLDDPAVAAAAVAVSPVMAVNVALGIADRVPDQFLVRELTGVPAPEGCDVGLAFILTVAQGFHADALSVALGFKHSEVAFLTVLEPQQ